MSTAQPGRPGPPGRRALARAATTAAAAGLLLATLAAPVYATWAHQTPTGATFTTATIQPVGNLHAAIGCETQGPAFDRRATVTLTWTPTTTPPATGYQIQRYRNGLPDGPPTTYADPAQAEHLEEGLELGTTYTWEITTLTGGWTSSPASDSGTTPASCHPGGGGPGQQNTAGTLDTLVIEPESSTATPTAAADDGDV